MSTITTVPHLVLDYDENIRKSITIPDEIKGDISAEHNYLYPILMRDYPKEWQIICEEVDQGIEAGTMIFNGADGTITLTGL
tara:strand:+ start:824 stop:1069 length:246 start_codon:yes stop_codon:yes gene_type:complete